MDGVVDDVSDSEQSRYLVAGDRHGKPDLHLQDRHIPSDIQAEEIQLERRSRESITHEKGGDHDEKLDSIM